MTRLTSWQCFVHGIFPDLHKVKAYGIFPRIGWIGTRWNRNAIPMYEPNETIQISSNSSTQTHTHTQTQRHHTIGYIFCIPQPVRFLIDDWVQGRSTRCWQRKLTTSCGSGDSSKSPKLESGWKHFCGNGLPTVCHWLATLHTKHAEAWSNVNGPSSKCWQTRQSNFKRFKKSIFWKQGLSFGHVIMFTST